MQLRSKRNNNQSLILDDAQQLPIQQTQQPLKIKRRKELAFVVYDVSPDGSDVSDASERTIVTNRRKKRALETTPRKTSARKEYNARSRTRNVSTQGIQCTISGNVSTQRIQCTISGNVSTQGIQCKIARNDATQGI
jgi:hypothetical protein